MAAQLIESLHERFKPTAFKDTHREQLLKLIERKAKGEEISMQAPEEPGQSDDLMAALEASLSGGKSKDKKARR